MDLKTLELFLCIRRLGAIGRAGAELGLSTTNASERIKALEAELGAKLLNRTTRSVSLTPDGEIFAQYAGRALGDLDDARALLSQDADQVSGVVRLSAPISFGERHILSFVPELVQQHPGLRLDLNLCDEHVDIVKDGYDFAIRVGELAPSSLLAQRIGESYTWYAASPRYLEEFGTPAVPQDLLNHRCLVLGDMRHWDFAERSADGAVRATHRIPVEAHVRSTFGNALVGWAADGIGIARAALWHAEPYFRSGQLVRVLPDFDDHPGRGIWIVRAPGRMMPARVKVVLEFLRQKIQDKNRAVFEACLSRSGCPVGQGSKS